MLNDTGTPGNYFTWNRKAGCCKPNASMIRPLSPSDAGAFVALRQQSFTTDPLSWDHQAGEQVSAADWAPRLQETENRVIFGYFLTEGRAVPELAGVIGLERPVKVKRRHRAMVWGVYVSPPARGHRAGQRLLAAAITRAKSMNDLDHLVLSVSNHASAACRLYQRAGFVEWGRELRAARTGAIWMDEIHMRLDL